MRLLLSVHSFCSDTGSSLRTWSSGALKLVLDVGHVNNVIDISETTHMHKVGHLFKGIAGSGPLWYSL